MVRTVPPASQASVDGRRAARPSMAAATDAASIGALNRIVTGSVSARLVENAVVKAAWVSGRIGPWRRRDGRRAGRPPPMKPMPSTTARPKTRPARTTGRASQQCADVDRERGRDGQQRDGGLTQ